MASALVNFERITSMEIDGQISGGMATFLFLFETLSLFMEPLLRHPLRLFFFSWQQETPLHYDSFPQALIFLNSA
jgi:hypothetical protein